MSTWNFLLTTFEIGLAFSLLAILAERLLIIYGFARGNTIGLVIVSFLVAIFKQLLNPNDPVYIHAMFIIIAGPFAVNRYDLANTLKKGRWWWKSQNDAKE